MQQSKKTITPFLQNHLETIRTYCRQYDVKKLYAFGSAITDRFNDKSDVDLIVAFKDVPFDKYADNYFELLEIFEKLFNRKVDLMTENSLSNPYFIKKLNQTKTLIYDEGSVKGNA